MINRCSGAFDVRRLMQQAWVLLGRSNESADDERPLESEWWLPDRTERLKGDLQFDRLEGARLRLRGDFADLPPRAWSRPVLLGVDSDGTPLTLLNPFWVQRPPPIAGLTAAHVAHIETVVQSMAVLRGAHVRTPGAFLIHEATVQLAGLRELCLRPPIPMRGISTGFVGDGDNGPLERTVEMAGGSLRFVYRVDTASVASGEVSKPDVEVQIRPDRALEFENFETDWLLPLQDLVIFAVREPTYIDSISVHLGSGTGKHERAALLMPLPGLNAEPRYEYKHPLVPFAALGDQANGFIEAWWELEGKLGSKATSVLTSAWGSRMFLDNRLLNEMSFAESYHRIIHDKPPISDDEHDRYVEAMLATVADAGHRKHYKARLRYAAAQGQRQRLKWLIRRASGVLPELPDLKPRLADRLVDTRNALTHLDETDTPPLTDEPLYRAIELLEITIQANVLLDLGLSSDLTAGLIRTSYLGQTPFVSIPDV